MSTICKVTPESSLLQRRLVEDFAKSFKNEMNYDFIQFESDETRDKSWFVNYEAFLFLAEYNPDKINCFGGCCFRWRDFKDSKSKWSLDWIWLEPDYRRQGHLQKAWSTFNMLYGDFHIAKPLSNDMEKFLDKKLTNLQK